MRCNGEATVATGETLNADHYFSMTFVENKLGKLKVRMCGWVVQILSPFLTIITRIDSMIK